MAFRVALSLILLFICSLAHGGPAAPDIVTLKQPDGAIIRARIRGDEFQNWVEVAETGHTVVRNQSSGYWEYGEESGDGSLRGNGIRVQPNGLNAPAGAKKGIRPSRNRELERSLQQTLQELYQQRLGAPVAGAGGAQAAAGDWVPSPVSGSRNALIILVNFSDRSLTTTADSWYATTFSTSPGALSVANYYRDNSFGSLTLNPVPHSQTGSPAGILTVTIAAAHPNSGSNFSYASETNILNLALAQAASYIDFAAYDTSGNGNLEQSELMVYFIYAGYEASGSSLTPNIWAHAWGGSITAGTKTVSKWALNGELNNASVQHPMGVIAHEMGHALCGLPDLYDISANNQAMGNFSLMAGGSWGRDIGQYGGTTPTVLDAWSRQFLGWTTPVTPTASAPLSIGHPLASPSSAWKLVNTAVSGSEYFLVENRQPAGWDLGLRGGFGSGWSGGLLITHVDSSAGTLGSNDINSYAANAVSPGHQGVVPVQASTAGCDMLAVPSGGCRGAVTTLFYSGNNSSWTPTTTPNSNYYNGTSTLFSLTGISAPAAIMTANLSLEPPVMQTLVVTRSGSGSGSVTSSPAGIACGGSCAGSFQKDTTVVLSAAPSDGSIFTGWSGGCSGMGGCQLTIGADVAVNAGFAPSATLWEQNFDAVTPASLPPGWQSSKVTDTSNPDPAWYTRSGTRYPSGIASHSGANLVLFNSYDVKSGDSALLASPSFSLDGIGNPQVKLWVYRDSGQYGAPSTNDDRVEVYANSAASLSGATLLGTAYRLTSMAPAVGANGWYETAFPIPPAFSGAGNYLLLKGIGGYGNDLHLDDISVVGSSAAPTPPSAPTFASALPGNGQATVSFTPPATDGGSPVLDYTALSSPGGFTASGPASPLTVTGLSNGTSYTFTVTARNAAGSSTPSAPSVGITPRTVPGAPFIGTAVAGDRQVTVGFTPPATDGGSPVLDYLAVASPGGLTASGPASPLTVTGLSNGTAYTFTVKARNAAGYGEASAASAVAMPYMRISINGTGYESIASAYAAVVDGFTISLRDLPFGESVNCNRPVVVTLKGGYDSGFIANGGITTISGSLTISSGSVTLENIAIY